jgi:hypothetical protein
MSLDSDPEIAAAFGSGESPASSAPVSDDPEIHAAFAQNRADSKKPFSTEDAVKGALSTVGNLALNIPYAAAHGVGDMVRSISGNQDAPETKFESALHVKPDEDATRLASQAAKLIPARAGGDAPDDTNVPTLGDTTQSIIGHGLRVANDVGGIAAGVGAVRGIASLGSAPKLPIRDAQSVIDQVAAKQSGGAAAASPNVADVSAPLRATIDKADPEKVDPTAMRNHIEADKFDIQLMKGQANRDPIQFSEEQNQSTHPIIAKRLNEQNEQMVNSLDEIRREASPTNVSNSSRENGQVAVDDLKAYDEPIRAQIKAKYQKLADANGGAIPIDTGATISNIDARLKKGSLTRTAANDPAVSEVMDNLRSGQPIDFESFESARSLLAGVQRRGGPAGVAAGIARDELEKMPLPAAAQPLKALADDARSAAAARFDALKRDPAYEAAVDDVNEGNARGKPSPLADTFLDDYALNRGAPKSQIDLMMQKLTDEGKGAVASHTLSAVRKGAINASGNVLPNGYNTALAKYADKLPSLVSPEVNDNLQSLGRVITNAKVAPAGASVAPKSGVIVRDAITGAVEHAANAKTMGAYGVLKRVFTKDGFAKEATAPGAGIER